MDDRRWEFLLREHQDLRSADQSFVQQLAALLSVVIVTAAAVAVSLESVTGTGKTPDKLPGWVWPLFPLPMLGVATLLVFLQVASNLRTQYAYEVEDAIQERVEFDEDFMFPSLFLLRRQGWKPSRDVWFPPLLATFFIALLAIFTVIVAINVVCIHLTRPHWLQTLSTCLETIAWVATGAVFVLSLFKRRLWKRAQPARVERAKLMRESRETP